MDERGPDCTFILVHLKEAKPPEMPVRAHRRTEDCSQVQLRDAHTRISNFAPDLLPQASPFLYALACLSSCLAVKTLVFHHLRLSVPYRRPSSRRSWRVTACTVFVSYRQSAALISSLLCASFFFSPLVCCRHAFIPPQLLIIKLFIM